MKFFEEVSLTAFVAYKKTVAKDYVFNAVDARSDRQLFPLLCRYHPYCLEREKKKPLVLPVGFPLKTFYNFFFLTNRFLTKCFLDSSYSHSKHLTVSKI